jgi:hypothetical protein
MIPLMALWANPLVRKIALYAAITLACLYALRLYGNAQWKKGEAKGRITATEAIEKEKIKEWKAKEDALILGAKEIGIEKQAVTEARIQVNVDRANLSRTLKDALAKLQAERGRQYENAVAIPDDKLWDAIRALSGELASTKP